MDEGGGNNNQSSRSTKTKRPSFFKVLVGDFTNQLRIPQAFLNNFNGKLPKVSILKSPTGRYWAVEMKRIDNDFFFRDGWERFVKKHSLEFGDFLVFRYNGKCKFYVKIYARNACEKEIAPVISKKTNVESNSPKKRQKVDEKYCAKVPRFNDRDREVKEKKNINIVEPISHKKKQKVNVATEKCAKVPRFNKYGREVKEKKNNVESSTHKKKKKVDVATEKCAKDAPRYNNGNGAEVEEKKKKKKATSTSAYVKPRRLHIVQIEENEDVDPNSCFIAACRPCTRQSLTVPRKVAEEHGFKKKESVKLRDPNDRLWQVRIAQKYDGRFVLDQGWNAFWNEHNLGGGEICRFKFMQGLDNEISVEIFRGGLTEYQSKRGGFVESVRDAIRLKTESNVIVKPKKEPVEEPERRFILVKDESDDSSMWL